MYTQQDLENVLEQMSDYRLERFAETIAIAGLLGAPSPMIAMAHRLWRQETKYRARQRTLDFGDTEFAEAGSSDS